MILSKAAARIVSKFGLLIVATVILVAFTCSVYLRPDFFPSVDANLQRPIEPYSGSVIFPLLIYSYNTILLIGTGLFALVLIWIWARRKSVIWTNGCAVLASVIGTLFLCSMCAASQGFSRYDLIRAAKVMENITVTDTLSSGQHAYHLTLASGVIDYEGDLSNYPYGLIVFQCDLVGVICHPGLIQQWGTESQNAVNARDFRLTVTADEIDVVFQNKVKFAYLPK